MDESDPLMNGLKHKAEFIKGKCKLCQYKDLCTGAMRVRGYRTYGDFWAPDPQCYLTESEIGLDAEKKEYLKKTGEDFPVPSELAR